MATRLTTVPHTEQEPVVEPEAPRLEVVEPYDPPPAKPMAYYCMGGDAECDRQSNYDPCRRSEC